MNGNNFNSMMNMTDNTMFATENSMAEITNNLEEYKKYINALLEDEELFKKISFGARKYVIKNHLLDHMLNKYKKLYNAAIKEDMSCEKLEDIFS